jgi:hypothetical protein
VDNQIVITVLTALVVIANTVVGIRAFRTALQIEKDNVWGCLNNTRHAGIALLIGFGVVCSILAGIKMWSIFDIFVRMWDSMHLTYQLRSFLFLAENFGVALLGWKVTTFIKETAYCQYSKAIKKEE